MTSPADESSNVPAGRVALKHSEHPAPRHSKKLGPTDTHKTVTVSVILARKNPLHLSQLGGRRLTHDEFMADYAADPAHYQAVRDFAAQHGLAVDEAASSLSRRTVVLRGSVKVMEKAFDVLLHDYENSDTIPHRYHGFEGVITVPSGLSGIIEAIFGLDARPVARPHFRMEKLHADGTAASAAGVTAAPAVGGVSYTPMQVAQLYNFPTGLDGTGQTIGILELGGGFTTTDLTNYFKGLGLTPPRVTAISVDGAGNTPGHPRGDDGEVMLDIEVAGAIAPGANIAVYFAPNTDQGFLDAITTAVHDTVNKPSVLSISWGGPESGWTAQAMNSIDAACSSAGALGVTITVATGDNGSTDDAGDSANHCDFPASSPHVLACGGTRLTASADGTQIQDETVWNQLAAGGGATGGGVSNQFALPAWQSASNVPKPAISTGGRGIPDVAGDADPATGYQVLVDGQAQVVGGTSAVAPLWAALVALINQQRASTGANPPTVGFFNPALYQASSSSAFRDITKGSNGGFSAGPGWDACTGLGSPNGQQLLTILGGTQSASATAAAPTSPSDSASASTPAAASDPSATSASAADLPDAPLPAPDAGSDGGVAGV